MRKPERDDITYTLYIEARWNLGRQISLSVSCQENKLARQVPVCTVKSTTDR